MTATAERLAQQTSIPQQEGAVLVGPFATVWPLLGRFMKFHVIDARPPSRCYCFHQPHCSRLRSTTYIWSRKGLDAGSARLLIHHVLFHAHTTHSVTVVLLLPGHVSGTASQQTYATRTSPTRVSGVNLKHTGFLAAGAQCDILLICSIQIALLNWTEMNWAYSDRTTRQCNHWLCVGWTSWTHTVIL